LAKPTLAGRASWAIERRSEGQEALEMVGFISRTEARFADELRRACATHALRAPDRTHGATGHQQTHLEGSRITRGTAFLDTRHLLAPMN
jgi:hypothetical protein